MVGLILGIALIITGAWTGFAHKHHLTSDLRIFMLIAIFLGGILVVAWLGGLMRF